MIIVFDLDDTLYEEMTYVRSGFDAVAQFAQRRWRVARKPMLAAMQRHLARSGRGQVFDAALAEFGIHSRQAARLCVATYRAHRPRIQLSAAGRRCLARFAASTKYLVTDGNARVQERKIAALGIRRHFRRVFVTHRYGVARAKPNPFCFLRIAELEGVSPRDVVYVADNPRKDFVGIRPLGFRTIRVRTGPYGNLPVRRGHDAELAIRDLDQLTPGLLRRLASSPSRKSKRQP
jgi:putative hydrolase of the HAD superfamily